MKNILIGLLLILVLVGGCTTNPESNNPEKGFEDNLTDNGTYDEEINDKEIIVKTYDGYRFPVKCDTVVVSEREANESFKSVVQGEGIELFVIGDALLPRNLSSAVHDGYRIGLRI